MSSDERELDEALKAAFESDVDGRSVIEQLGARSRIMLHDPADDPTPLVKIPAQRSDESAEDDSRYQIVGELARGGVGVVYKSRDRELGRDVALKVLRSAHAQKPEVLDRFIEEAQIGGQLQHPGIVPVYGLGMQPDGRPYFTMKLIKGRTLGALLKERKDPGDARRRYLQVFEQVCQTIAYAHTRGVIHRDLKPSNVMVGSYGEVLVVDWGFGKVLGRPDHSAQRLHERTVIATVRSESEGSHSIAGSVMGTPAYMPPEQALGHIDELDEQSDVFSLGAILCEILTGEPPYAGAQKDLLVQAAQARLDDAFERLDGCGADEDLVELTKRCLSPLRSKRPENGGALGRAIADHLAAAEERAHKAELRAVRERAHFDRERAQAVWEKRAKKKTRVVAAALLAAVLLGGGSYFFHDAQQRKRAAKANPLVEAAMEDATHRGAQGKWTEALAVARQAVALAADADAETRARAEDLQHRTTEAERAADAAAKRADTNRRFVARLEEIRLQRSDKFDHRRTDAAYTKAFEAHGIDVASKDAAALIRGRFEEIAVDLAAALDEWAWVRRAYLGGDWKQLHAIAKRIDRNDWRNHLRDAVAARNLDRLHALADEALEKGLAVRSLDQLGIALAEAGDPEAATAFLRRAQRMHPEDFWIAYHAAYVAAQCKPPRLLEAVRFYTAALAIRPRSAVWNNLSVALWKVRKWKEAMAGFRTAIRLQPDRAMYHANLGGLLGDKGRHDEAIAACRRAIELDPGYADAYSNLGAALRDKGLLDEAFAAFRHAIRLDPADPAPRVGLGSTFGLAGNVEEAIAAIREAMRIDPEYARAHINLGWVLEKAGKIDAALAAYREGIRLDAQNAYAYNGLGAILFNVLGDIDGGIASFRQAISIDPTLAMAHYNLGVCLLKKGRPEEALEAFREAVRLRPDNAEARTNLGVRLAAKGLADQAIAEFREAIRLNPKLALTHVNLGSELAKKGLLDEAIARFREALRLNPGQAEAHHRLGLALGRKGLVDNALAAMREAIRLDPKRAQYHGDVAWLLGRKRRFDEAVASYREAIRLDPNEPRYHSGLGTAFAAEGLWDEAVAPLREAIRLDPEDAGAHYNLGVALKQEGDFAGAVAALRRGHALGSRLPTWTAPSAGQLRAAERALALEKKLAAIDAGTAQPSDARERIELAQIYSLKKRPAAAARLYRKALADGPALVAKRYRYLAARAAALAGSGQGRDAKELDDAARASWREQGLAWLRAELARGYAATALKSWQRDRGFSGVRDEAELKKLPPEEQQQWRAFWKEVAALAAKGGK